MVIIHKFYLTHKLVINLMTDILAVHLSTGFINK